VELHPRLHHPERAARQYGDLARRFSAALDRDDPLADRVHAVFEADPGERGRFERALSGAPVADLSTASQDLLAAVEATPPWVDRARIERGGRLFFRAGVLGGLALARSLVGGYASPVGNKPLVLSGRLEHDVSRRLAETGVYVAATHSPEGLQRGGAGFAANVRVRLIHAMVRAMARRSPRWRPEWGVPINQHDMAGTIFLFSTVWIDGVRALGLEVSASEEADHYHLWRYAAHLLGVEPELVPESADEARRAFSFIEFTEGDPDADSRRLVSAMFGSIPQSPITPLRRAFGAGVMRGLLGDREARALGVPEPSVPEVISMIRGIVRPVDQLAHRSRRVERWLVRQGEAYWRFVNQLPESAPGPRHHGAPGHG
jgi:hypothetical protein